MTKIIPHLWFDDRAEEAARYYVSIFKNAKIKQHAHYSAAHARVAGMLEGSVMTISFELEGQDFVALNGGPVFRFNEAISLMVICKNQEEVDYFWKALTAGGDESAQQCGWLKDKYGLSWQVVPAILEKWLEDEDAEKAHRVAQALLPMKKINVEALRKAYEGE